MKIGWYAPASLSPILTSSSTRYGSYDYCVLCIFYPEGKRYCIGSGERTVLLMCSLRAERMQDQNRISMRVQYEITTEAEDKKAQVKSDVFQIVRDSQGVGR